MYCNWIDITDLVNSSEEGVVDIELARVRPSVYTGEKQAPEVVYQGETLQDGTDYVWEPASSQDEGLTDAGTYMLLLSGKGRFTGAALMAFDIVLEEDAAEALVDQAQDEYEAAKAAMDTAVASGDAAVLEAAYTRLIDAQDALTEAKDELARTGKVLSKEKQKELEDRIENLEGQIDDLEGQMDNLDKQIAEKDKQIADKDKQIGDKDKEITEKDKQIGDLQDKNKDLGKQNQDLGKQNQDLGKENESLGKQNKDLTDKLAKAKFVDITNYQVTMKTRMAYTGKPVKPAVKVSGVAASSYRVYYSSNTKVGLAKLTITPTDPRYKGKITRTFKIVPKKATVSKATAGKGKMTVKAGKTAAGTGGTKYQVQYRRYGTYKWKSKKTKKRTLTIKKLTKGRKYQVRIRAFKKVGKKTYYGAWSKIKTTGKIK